MQFIVYPCISYNVSECTLHRLTKINQTVNVQLTVKVMNKQ